MLRSATDSIVVHCAATRPDQDIGTAEIRAWHLARGWRDIGYHFVIRHDGTVERGRPEAAVGAHVRGHNARSVGVCLIGGLDDTGTPAASFTGRQWDALAGLVEALRRRYPGAAVVGHRDLDPGKACPSFDVAAWLRTQPAIAGEGA